MNYVTAFGDRPIELEISEINAVLESISPSSGFNECTELMKRMKAPPGGGPLTQIQKSGPQFWMHRTETAESTPVFVRRVLRRTHRNNVPGP
jgi:hypothetical protein